MVVIAHDFDRHTVADLWSGDPADRRSIRVGRSQGSCRSHAGWTSSSSAACPGAPFPGTRHCSRASPRPGRSDGSGRAGRTCRPGRGHGPEHPGRAAFGGRRLRDGLLRIYRLLRRRAGGGLAQPSPESVLASHRFCTPGFRSRRRPPRSAQTPSTPRLSDDIAAVLPRRTAMR